MDEADRVSALILAEIEKREGKRTALTAESSVLEFQSAAIRIMYAVLEEASGKLAAVGQTKTKDQNETLLVEASVEFELCRTICCALMEPGRNPAADIELLQIKATLEQSFALIRDHHGQPH